MRPSRANRAKEKNHPTRQRLVDEAARQIMAGGTESVDVELLLTNVGVTKGSLYHYFESVNDLFIAGLLQAFESALRESEAWTLSLRDDCSSAREARDRLHAIIDISQTPERRPMRSLRLHALSLARTQPGLADEIARLQARLTNTMTEVNREFQRRGWMRTDIDARAVAVLIQAMNLGRIVDDVVDDVDRVDSGAWISLYNDVLDRNFIIDD